MSSTPLSLTVNDLLMERPDYLKFPSPYYSTELYYLKQSVLSYPLLNSLLDNEKDPMCRMPSLRGLLPTFMWLCAQNS